MNISAYDINNLAAINDHNTVFTSHSYTHTHSRERARAPVAITTRNFYSVFFGTVMDLRIKTKDNAI